MKRIDSEQKWEMKIAGEDIVYPATVPGSVYNDLILSDNFFDLNGGEKRVKVLKGSTDKLEVRSVYSIK